MQPTTEITRRDFLKVGAAAGGGLLIAVYVPGCGPKRGPAAEPPFKPNAWVRVGTDDVVTVVVDKSEMGQGVLTSLPMLVAEELDADWSKVRIESAPADPAYANTMFGMQATGGSTSVRSSWDSLRKAGATGRAMLVAAAAETWGVEPATCRAEKGVVIHEGSGRRMSYGDLAEKAATLPVPEDAPLKDPQSYRIIGSPVKRLDTPWKVDGSGVFGIDVRLPGMLFATVARCPVFGGKVSAFDATAAQAVPGVKRVVEVPSGIAVVAESTWAAMKGREALDVTWDEGPTASVSSASIRAEFERLARGRGAVARDEGDVERALAGAARRVEAVYEVPYLAHATMEPMNATADVRPDGCDVWVPTQFQGGCHDAAAQITGLPKEKVKVHTTLLGGGFGRRFELDFVTEALHVSKAVGVPVMVTWSREDDTRHDFYRPNAYSRFVAGLDAGGWPVAWRHHIVSPSIMSRVFPQFVQKGIDESSVEGAANLPYAIPNLRVEYTLKETGVPVGFWRSVGHSQNAYVTECFLDEVAAAGGKDPYQLRRRLLANHSRHLAVVELAAQKAGWGSALPAGRGRGIAVHESFGSFVAEVAEVSVADDGTVRVHRVV
ncbi:MAG: molybdopterin cofactor-binding domain-containing protein, partial [Gemmatimonadota bacterium]